MVSTGGALDMHVHPTEIVGREGVFRITLLNQMTWPVYVVLAARDSEDGLRFRIEPEDAVIVPAGALAGPITVRAVPRVRTLIGEPHPYQITFDGLMPWSEDASTPALVQRAHFTYVPRYTARLLPLWLRRAPGWALLLPLVLLVLLLVLAGGRTLASPSTRALVTPLPVPMRVVPAIQPPRPRAVTKGRVLSPSMPSASSRRFTLHIARAAPTATPVPRPTETSTPPPTSTPDARPAALSTPPPTSMPTLRPTETSTPSATGTPTPPPTATSTPRPTATPTPVFVTVSTTLLPAGVMSTPTAVPVTCCLAQP